MSVLDYLFPNPEAAKGRLLNELANIKGATRLEASYSGGNDEGGVDAVRVFNATGEELALALIFEPGEDAWEHPLWEAANAVVSTKYGTWAGEFSAHGTLYADLVLRMVAPQG